MTLLGSTVSDGPPSLLTSTASPASASAGAAAASTASTAAMRAVTHQQVSGPVSQ